MMMIGASANACLLPRRASRESVRSFARLAMNRTYPFYVAGQPRLDGRDLVVTDKYSGNHAAIVKLADRKAVDQAIAVAVEAAPQMRRLAGHKRQAILGHVLNRLRERFEEFAQIMCVEAGKPIKDARGEVTRAIDTFR